MSRVVMGCRPTAKIVLASEPFACSLRADGHETNVPTFFCGFFGLTVFTPPGIIGANHEKQCASGEGYGMVVRRQGTGEGQHESNSVCDTCNTKPVAVDAGYPTADLSLDPDTAGFTNGKRVNIGAYGNTPWATVIRKPGLVLYYR